MIFFLSSKITSEEGLVYYTVNIFGSQSRNFNYLMMKKVLWYLMIFQSGECLMCSWSWKKSSNRYRKYLGKAIPPITWFLGQVKIMKVKITLIKSYCSSLAYHENNMILLSRKKNHVREIALWKIMLVEGLLYCNFYYVLF